MWILRKGYTFDIGRMRTMVTDLWLRSRAPQHKYKRCSASSPGPLSSSPHHLCTNEIVQMSRTILYSTANGNGKRGAVPPGRLARNLQSMPSIDLNAEQAIRARSIAGDMPIIPRDLSHQRPDCATLMSEEAGYYNQNEGRPAPDADHTRFGSANRGGVLGSNLHFSNAPIGALSKATFSQREAVYAVQSARAQMVPVCAASRIRTAKQSMQAKQLLEGVVASIEAQNSQRICTAEPPAVPLSGTISYTPGPSEWQRSPLSSDLNGVSSYLNPCRLNSDSSTYYKFPAFQQSPDPSMLPLPDSAEWFTTAETNALSPVFADGSTTSTFSDMCEADGETSDVVSSSSVFGYNTRASEALVDDRALASLLPSFLLEELYYNGFLPSSRKRRFVSEQAMGWRRGVARQSQIVPVHVALPALPGADSVWTISSTVSRFMGSNSTESGLVANIHSQWYVDELRCLVCMLMVPV
jgi:hypothetical protein